MQKRRYPLIPVVVIVLKVIAVAVLLFLGTSAISSYISAFSSWFHSSPQQSMFGMQMAPAVKGFGPRMMSLLQPTLSLMVALGLPSLAWGLSDVMHASREIEFRTRPSITEQEEPAEEEKAATA